MEAFGLGGGVLDATVLTDRAQIDEMGHNERVAQLLDLGRRSPAWMGPDRKSGNRSRRVRGGFPTRVSS